LNDPYVLQRKAVVLAITLQPVTRENFRACLGLQLPPEQQRHVAPNVYSLAEAYVTPEFTPRAIYAGDGLVGFAMYGLETDTGRWWLIRLMIDFAHQGRGYGRAALGELVDEIVAQYRPRELVISTEPDNAPALGLYRSFGFRDTGEMDEDELVLTLDPALLAATEV
jgi:diamine N-acetyltransferase